MREGTAVVGFRQKSHFKSGLLIGAAGLAAAGVSGGAAAADPAAGTSAPADSPKWLPYASVGGGVGDATAGAQGNLFVPVWQDLDSLLFVRLGVGTQTRDKMITNFGLGYRTKIDSDWIVGLYGGIDASRTKYDHTFTQGTIGAELMSADWDVRINGYLATADKLKDVAGTYSLYIHDTRIAILQAQEGSYSGFDGEVGYRVFATDNADFRVFAGGFSFSRDDARATSSGRGFDFGYRDITGPMGRAEVDIYDIDALGTQSRVTLSGQISHDDVRGTSGYVGASLRIPLGAGWGEGGQALDDLDRRMVDEVRRQDNVLTTWSYSKPEPVIIYNGTITSEPTNTLYYVSDDTPGAGSYSNPTSLGDATSRTAANSFIVVTDFGGPVTGGVTVHPGQTVVGGGGTFSVLGTVSDALFSHDFAPASGTPTLVPATPGGNIITIDGGNASIYGVTFTGDFGAAIYGHNVDDVVIGNVTIDGSGGGQYGVQVVQDMSQNMNLHISNSTITGLGVYGVNVNTTVSDGGTSNQTIELTNSAISGSGVADVSLSNTVSGGSTVNQSIVIDPTVITGGDYGILIAPTVDGGTLNQTIDLHDLTISGTTYAGIMIDGHATNGGVLDQSITITNVSIDGSGAPLAVYATATYAGEVHQTIDLTNVTASNATYTYPNYVTNGENIRVAGYASYGGVVTQSGTWTNVTANNGVDDGVEIGAYAYAGGSVTQRFAISGLTAVGNHDVGFDAFGTASDKYGYYGPTVVAQYLTLDNATISGTYGVGIGTRIGAFGYYAAALQELTVTNSTITHNDSGIYAVVDAVLGGSAQQIVTLDNDTVDHNYYNGGVFGAAALASGFASQTVNIYNSSFSYNGEDGVYLIARAKYGANVEQNANIYFSSLSHNGGAGLNIDTRVGGYLAGPYYRYYSQVTQNVIVAYSTLSHNSGDGAHIHNYAGYGGQLNQLLYFYGDQLNANGGDGIHEISYANAYRYLYPVSTTAVSSPAVSHGYYAVPTNLYSDLYVVNSTAMNNYRDGINVKADMTGSGYLIQHVTVAGTDASFNGRTGFVDYADASGIYSLNLQYITLSGSYFDGNGLDGAAFLGSQKYGPLAFGAAIQVVTINGSDFSGNYRDGLYADVSASGFQGRAEQYFTIGYSRFDYNGHDGMYLQSHAQGGTYVAGYDCGTVQGLDGGCAIVRQTVSLSNSAVDHNGGHGIEIYTSASDYGAIYAEYGRSFAPTLAVVNSDISYNGGDGIKVANDVQNGSYVFQFVYLGDSTINGNAGDGVHVSSYVANGSTMLQLLFLYSYAAPMTVSGNGGHGVDVSVEAQASSYVVNENVVIGADLSYNGGFGFKGAISYGDATSTVEQANVLVGSTLNHNMDGVGLYSIGPGAEQYSYIYQSEVAHNAFVGVYGEANFGAYQYVYVYTGGNSVHDNGTNYLFNAFGGATQVLN